MSDTTVHPVDAAYAAMMAANSAVPRDNEQCARLASVFEASVLVAVGGDKPYADAVIRAFYDSGEDFGWYTTQWTRDQFVSATTRVPRDVVAQVLARSGQSEISHAAAREIAAAFVAGTGITRTFVETGEIAHRTDVWRDLFGYGVYSRLTADDSAAADALGTYLINRADTGPVIAWSALTLADG